MKVFFSIVFWLLAYSLPAQPDLMEWGKPVRYDDFQAKPDEADTAAARIDVSIELGYVADKQGLMKYQTKAFVDKSRSWIKIHHRKSYILEHEQGHFDLAHITAKQMLDTLETKKFRKHQAAEIEKVYDQFLEALHGLETQYDRETKGGSDPKAQQRWNERIRKDLAAIQ